MGEAAGRKPVVVDIASTFVEDSVQGQRLLSIIHTGTAFGTTLSSYGVQMPPRHVTRAHVHRHGDVIVQIMRGWAATLWGPEMKPLCHGPGQQVWIPSGLEHAAVNLSRDAWVLAFEFRSDPEPNRDVELLPDLDATAAARVEGLQADHHERILRARAEGRMSW